jgi:hypothetical protein
MTSHLGEPQPPGLELILDIQDVQTVPEPESFTWLAIALVMALALQRRIRRPIKSFFVRLGFHIGHLQTLGRYLLAQGCQLVGNGTSRPVVVGR